MPYTYADAEKLVTTPPQSNVGSGHCVPLVQQYARAPNTSLWKEGTLVRGGTITKGTAIATFVAGKYADHNTGNHAALYISQDNLGIWVVDQYLGSGGIHKHHIKSKDKLAGGKFKDPSNNGDAFSVIE